MIKSYTDLEQSKKLAEILPLESADMKILPFTEREYRIVPVNDIAVCGRDDEIYAWSLAALLGVLPEIQGGKPVIALYDNYVTYPHMSNLYTKADNLVDACVDMIIKLNELNML